MSSLRSLIYLKIARMSRGSNTPVPSIISYDTKIKGDVWGGDTIHIDGKLEGNIMCNEVIIGTRGYILGDIKAKKLSVYGTVNGTIDTEELFVANNARLIGNSYYTRIALEPGAYVEGNCIPRAKANNKNADNENKNVELKAVK